MKKYIRKKIKDVGSWLSKTPKWVYISLIIYTVIFTYLSYLRYDLFMTGWDFGAHLNIFENSMDGNFFYSDEFGMNHLGNHFNFFHLFLFPFYFILRSPITLFFFQAFGIALGAIPVYHISKKYFFEKKDQLISKVFVFSYLIFPYLWQVTLEDFHPNCFFVPFLFFALYFLDSKKWKGYYISLFFLILVEENITLTILFLGLYVFFKIDKMHGIYTTLIGGVSFVILINILIPSLNTGNFIGPQSYMYFNIRYGYLGESLSDIIRTIIFNPVYAFTHTPFLIKVNYFVFFTKYLLFLPFFSPLFFSAIPVIFQNILSRDTFQACYTSHHNFALIPILFVSAIYGLKRVQPLLKRAKIYKQFIVLILIVSISSAGFYGVYPFFVDNRILDNTLSDGEQCFKNELKFFLPRAHYVQENHKEIKSIIDKIPEDSYVIASPNIYPNLYQKKLFKSTHFFNNLDLNPEGDYIFIESGDADYPFSTSIGEAIINLENKGYKLIWNKETAFLFKKTT